MATISLSAKGEKKALDRNCRELLKKAARGALSAKRKGKGKKGKKAMTVAFFLAMRILGKKGGLLSLYPQSGRDPRVGLA